MCNMCLAHCTCSFGYFKALFLSVFFLISSIRYSEDKFLVNFFNPFCHKYPDPDPRPQTQTQRASFEHQSMCLHQSFVGICVSLQVTRCYFQFTPVICASAAQLSTMVSKAANTAPGHGAVKGNKPSKSFKSEDVENLMKTITQLTGSSSNSDVKVGKSGALSTKQTVIKKSFPPVSRENNVKSKSAGKDIVTNGKKFVTAPTARNVEPTSKANLNKSTVPMGGEKFGANWWLLPNGTPKVPQLQIGAESLWYSFDDNITALQALEKSKRLTVDSSRLSIITSAVKIAFEAEVSAYQSAKGSKMSGDQKWINDVLKSGTLSDKVAALALVVQESPIHELSALDTLIGLASKEESYITIVIKRI